LALEGNCTEHHRYVLRHLLGHLGYPEGQINEFSGRISQQVSELLPVLSQERLDRIPGVNRKTIENVIAEIGVDMTVFPDEHHLASWCGMCPGNEQSAGKRLRTRTCKGNRWLRRALAEAAWAASQVKRSYLKSQFRRLAAKRGKKRALVAVGHSLLVIIYCNGSA
jgi:transposase